jgi:AcrR family transcriptional regulator
MPRETRRRDELAAAATDYVLAHGLLGVSLRPMAAALGTSDRMLLYHFTSKDDLVATVLRVANERSVAEVRRMPPARDVHAAVLDLWTALTSPPLEQCQRTYVEAAALGLFGREPYASVVREGNGIWEAAVADHLVAAGMPEDRAGRAVALLDAAMTGFALDLPLLTTGGAVPPPAQDLAVRDLAEAVVAIAGARTQGDPQGRA